MRIVHISTLHPALDVRIFHKECRTLAAAGYEVHLLTSEPPAEERDGVRFHALGRTHSALRPLRIQRRLANAYRRARALRADVYHFHDPELIPVAVLLRRGGARVIYDVHEDAAEEAISLNPHRPVYRALKAGAFRLFDAIARRTMDHFVCATPALAARFPADQTTAVLNYPLPEEFALDHAQRQTVRRSGVCYVGGISEIRGIRQMIEAIAMLPASLGTRLSLVGPFDPPELESQVRLMPGWRQVDYLGPQPRERLADILGSAAAGLVLFQPGPNHSDSLPNKLFEYMAAGLPVVASDFPEWRDIIARVGCGLCVDPTSPKAIAEAIERILSNPEDSQTMSERGRAAVHAHYNWTAEGKKLLAVYDGLSRE